MSLSARHAAVLFLALVMPAPLLLADGTTGDQAGPREGPLDDHGDDAVAGANALRVAGCGDRPAVAAPLVPDPRLDAAAARVAAGEGLQGAASAAGYRAARVARIRVVNAIGAAYTSILEAEFCALLGDPELTDVGLYRTGDETWLVLAAPLSLADGVGAAGAAEALFAAINAARSVTRRCGGAQEHAAAPPLRRSAALDDAAILHARDIAQRGALGHDGADGSTAAERVALAGYRWSTVGENVAAGQRQPEETVDTWLASPGHCKNLMDPRFRDTGVAVAVNEDDDRVIYWVQVYAAPQ